MSGIHHHRRGVGTALPKGIDVAESPRNAAKRANWTTTNFQIAADVRRKKQGRRVAIIFAQAILMFPEKLLTFLGANYNIEFLRRAATFLQEGEFFYMVTYGMMILFFSYFWVATQFNEIQIAEENWLQMIAKDLLMETVLTTKLVLTQGVNSVNYRWRAVNGVVYFMGRARGRAELDKVVDLARMPGVRKIVSHVFLTDHMVLDILPDATAEVKTEPAIAEAKPEPTGVKTKAPARSVTPRSTPPAITSR